MNVAIKIGPIGQLIFRQFVCLMVWLQTWTFQRMTFRSN